MATGNVGQRNTAFLAPVVAATKRTKEVVVSSGLTLSGTNLSSSVITRAVLLAYADSTGSWRLRFNIRMIGTSGGVRTKATITFASPYSVLFKSTASAYQAVAAFLDTTSTIQCNANANPGASTIDIYHASSSESAYCVSGDVELDGEPSWAAANAETIDELSLYPASDRQVLSFTAAQASGMTLISGVVYIIDMSAATGSISLNAPTGSIGYSFKVIVIGNLTNGYTVTVNRAGTDTIYKNGVTALTSYTLTTLESWMEFFWDDKTLAAWTLTTGGSSGSGAGASLLDPNYDETFIYYTRSDFTIDAKTFFGSTTGTDSISSFGKVILGVGQQFISANLLGSVFLADNPVINTSQVRLLYTSGKVDNTFTFTVTAANATVGAVYTNGSYNYTVLSTITGGTTLSCSGNGMMGSSGTLTKVSGTGGDSTITYSATVGVTISVSADGGSNYTAASNTYISGLFVIADFTMASGTTSTSFKMKVVSNTAASELAGFGVNLVQDSTGAYAGDATFETRIITSTEASTGLISLTTVKFTPGAHQLHVIYSGHDFMAPTFSEIGGGAVQFPINFFTLGDTVYFYVAYGLVQTGNAPMTINNMLSSNSTLGSVVVPTGFTLDKPWMEIPAGAVITGAGNVETTGVITGAGILATTGSVVSTAKAPTQPVYDTVVVNGWVKLQTSGGTPAQLDFCEVYYHNTTVSDMLATPVPLTLKIVRVGSQVTVTMLNSPTTGASNKTTTTAPAIVDALPARFRCAASQIQVFVTVSNGGSYAFGYIDVRSTGAMTFFRDAPGNAWSNANPAIVIATSFSYNV